MTSSEIRRLREGLGLSQQALADELGVNRVTVAKWEAGMRNISEPAARLLRRIADDAPRRHRPKTKRSHGKRRA